MNFECLTFNEIKDANIKWSRGRLKNPEVINSAISAGFSEVEVKQSHTGELLEDFKPDNDYVFKKGALVLMGYNGLTLIEISI